MINRAICIFVLFISTAYSGDKIRKEGFHKIIDSLILNKDLDNAEKLAIEARKQYPQEPEITCALACVYRNKARKPFVNINLGELGMKEGESGKVELPSDSAKLKEIFKERVTYDREEYKKAEILYKELISHSPQYTNAYYNLLDDYVTLEEFENYFGIVSLFIKNVSDSTEKQNSLLELGAKLAKNPDVDPKQAIRFYEIILKSYPDWSYARSDLGAMYLKDGNIEKAEPLLNQVYDIDPGDQINAMNYLSSLVYLEKFDLALPISKGLAEADPSFYFIYGLLSYITDKPYQNIFHTYGEKKKKSVKNPDQDFWCSNASTFEKIDTMGRDNKIGYLEYLLENFSGAQMYHPEAVVIGNIILKNNGSSYALMVLGSIFDRHLMLSQTIKYLDLIQERRKTDPNMISEENLIYNYGRIYLATGHYAEAQKYFRKREKMGSVTAQLNHYLGLCAMNLDNNDEAISYFEKNSRLNDKDQMEFINRSIWMLRKLSAEKK